MVHVASESDNRTTRRDILQPDTWRTIRNSNKEDIQMIRSLIDEYEDADFMMNRQTDGRMVVGHI